MTLKVRSAPLAEINKNSGAHLKISTKIDLCYRLQNVGLGVVSKNIRYMRMYVSLITARCYAKRGYEIARRLSVCVIFTQVGILRK